MDRQHFIDMAQREVGKPNRFGGQFAKSKLIRASDGTNHSEAIFSSDDGQAIAVVKIDRDNGLYIKVYRESTSIISMVDTEVDADEEQLNQEEEAIQENQKLFQEAERFLYDYHRLGKETDTVSSERLVTELQRHFRIGYKRAKGIVSEILYLWYNV